jgi:ribonuclease HII
MWAGVDEVGRGPLIGSVVAAAVVLPQRHHIGGLRDSKKLSQSRRELIATVIEREALAFSLAEASAREIDQLNIHQASLLAMRRAVEGLPVEPWGLLVDGRHVPETTIRLGIGMVKGDDRVDAIKAASILAKVHRDRQMVALHDQYPEYGFAQHKGYPTPSHLAALKQFGLLAEHRRSYGPCRNLSGD